VVNVSEGRDRSVLASLVEASGACLLDLHSDADHHRSVFTLAGEPGEVEAAVRDLARSTVEMVDLGRHCGAHPRFGALDVVPWVTLQGWPLRDAAQSQVADGARQARDRFATWAANELGLPVFLYGPERSLSQVRKRAWASLPPDLGPHSPHPTAGAVAAGCRPLMVAYNLWMQAADLAGARAVAATIRSESVQALAFRVGDHVQVSCNLVAPLVVGPAAVWDSVAKLAPVARAELVGLVPRAVLERAPEDRWDELDLGPDRTIEAHLCSSGHQRPRCGN
jgi:glutamate formiminotransferase